MRHCHGFVVTLKKSREISRQIIFVRIGKCTHDAEVNARIDTIAADENIARMHIGVKKSVAKYLRKKYFHAIAGQPGNVDIGGF